MDGMSYTVSGLQTTIMDNADFRETQSVAKAKAFATAVVRFLALAPESSSDQGTSMTLGRDQLVELRKEAIALIAANESSGGSVLHLGVGTQFRR